MSLFQRIKEEMKEAMRRQDELRLTVVRSLVAAFTNELLAKKGKPAAELSDEDVLALIRRGVKQRKDSIEQFEKGGRSDLVKRERAELAVLEAYLPAMMSEAAIKKAVAAKKKELGISDKEKIPALMKAVMAELKGKADGAAVKKAVDASFSGA